MITELLNVNLMKELGLDDIDSDNKKEFLDQMTQTLDSRIGIEILNRLSGEDKIELDKLLDSNEDMTEFLKNKIPNFDILVAETIAGLKKEVLDLNKFVSK